MINYSFFKNEANITWWLLKPATVKISNSLMIENDQKVRLVNISTTIKPDTLYDMYMPVYILSLSNAKQWTEKD